MLGRLLATLCAPDRASCWGEQVLGTPSREDIQSMNPNYTEFQFPQIKAHPWSKVFSKRLPPDAVDLVGLNRLDLCLDPSPLSIVHCSVQHAVSLEGRHVTTCWERSCGGETVVMQH